jgi:hypothetical protein
MWSGAAMVLLGVLAGGILVYRTKRESYETLLAPKREKSTGPVHIDDGLFAEGEEEDEDPLQNVAAIQTSRFLSQIAAEAKEEVEKGADK